MLAVPFPFRKIVKTVMSDPSEGLPIEFDRIRFQGTAKQQTIRGYNLKTNFKAVNETEKKARKKVVAETVLKALRRMNKL